MICIFNGVLDFVIMLDRSVKMSHAGPDMHGFVSLHNDTATNILGMGLFGGPLAEILVAISAWRVFKNATEGDEPFGFLPGSGEAQSGRRRGFEKAKCMSEIGCQMPTPLEYSQRSAPSEARQLASRRTRGFNLVLLASMGGKY